MNTTIRTGVPADMDGLIALSRETIRTSYGPFLGDEAVKAFIESGAADRYLKEHIDRAAVILCDEEIVGYAVCRDNMIDLLMIDRASHRRGLGTRLLRHVEATLFETYDALRLDSFEGNRIANAFYRKNGWREVSRHFDEESGGKKIIFGKSA